MFIFDHYKHESLHDRELLIHLLQNQHLINLKIDKVMSTQDDVNVKLAALGVDIDGIAEDQQQIADGLGNISTEITDLKTQIANGGDQTATLKTLTDLETRTAAAKTALDSSVTALKALEVTPETPPATGTGDGSTPPPATGTGDGGTPPPTGDAGNAAQ